MKKIISDRKAPWLDRENNELFEGDNIKHPSGEVGVIEFHGKFKDHADQWRVNYGEGVLSRLCLQIGGKGLAEKIKNN